MSTTDLEARIARLEAIEAIKSLKARYWSCCDAKDVEGVRNCFVDGPVEIHYDGPVGLVRHRDGLYEVFKNVACQDEIIEMHHGGPAQIEITGAQSAVGRWGLVYHLMNTEQETLSVCGGYYDDEYAKLEGQWLIQKARFKVNSVVTYGWKKGLRLLYRGGALPQ
jgi:hypothetical protein